jgi:UDP-N-acetyl-D-mannosaminuronic acid dehydrogenase
MNFEKVSVIGLGYIGLPTATVLASSGIYVNGVDVNQTTVDIINSGCIHIVEPGLDKLVEKVIKSGHLIASSTPDESDAYIIAVPTPFTNNEDKENLEPDLSFVKSAAKSIAKFLRPGNLVILESTCPVGATEKLNNWLAEERKDLKFPLNSGENSDIRIAYCPERVLPGKVVKELVSNDRVIGGITQKCAVAAASLYKTFVSGECTTTDSRTAEMVKLTENASRDVSIAFANELSVICDELNINVWELINLANKHPRVDILSPGPGVGGHCIAVDPWFIISKSPHTSNLIKTARVVNDNKPGWVLKKFDQIITDLSRKKKKIINVACYGLSFKPDIDDLRESPALEIAIEINKLDNIKLCIVEPHITSLPDELLSASLLDIENAFTNADLHLLLVDHSIFKDRKPNKGLILDTKGIWTEVK